jgi:hypothetical protein
VEEGRIEKARQVVGLYPHIVRLLIESAQELVGYSLARLRETGQWTSKVSIESIRGLKEIGEAAAFINPKISEEAIYEIANIANQHLYNMDIAKEGIKAIAGFRGYRIDRGFPEEFPREIRTKANEELIHILVSLSTKSSKDFPANYKASIARLILSNIEAYTPYEGSRLIIIGTVF